jgi:hypothetical protein
MLHGVTGRLCSAVVCAAVVAVPAAVAASFTFHDSVSSADSDQKGMLAADDPATTCAASTTAAVGHLESTNYDLYSFRNASNSTQCVTVEVVLDPLLCPVANSLQSAAYSPGFDPAAITANYLGDIGATPEPSKSYAFNVPAGTAFQVTVNETNPNAGCNSYTLTVTGTGVTTSPTAVGLISFAATRVNRGVRLRWRTGSGAQALGFNIYREQSGKRVRLNRRLLPSSKSGGWLDRVPSSSYWLQEVGADGARIWHGPARLGE